MRSHEIKFKLSTADLLIIGLGIGIVLGIPAGIAAYKYGLSTGISDNYASVAHAGASLDGDSVCVNGIVYAPDQADSYPAWQGVYKPLAQSQPVLIDENGQESIQRSIPVRCTIQRTQHSK